MTRTLYLGGLALVVGLGLFAAGFMVGRPRGEQAPLSSVPFDYSEGWKLRSKHLVYGMPRLTDLRYGLPDGTSVGEPGVSVLVREGFVIGHFDHGKLPLWMSMKWTAQDYALSEAAPDHKRDFKPDLELPSYARGKDSYGKGNRSFDRGHLARNKDNSAWGEDNADSGDLMSNIAPQSPKLNRGVWLNLENETHRAVTPTGKGLREIWVLAGCVFDGGNVTERTTNGTAIPSALFKVVAWHDAQGRFHAQGFLFPQEAEGKDLQAYMVSIDRLEELTGLDFFPELGAEMQREIEARTPRAIWRD